MKLKYVLLAFFIMISGWANAQNLNLTPSFGGITLAPLTTTGKSLDESNMFFTESWCEGSLSINIDTKGLSVPKLKYNIVEDKIIMQNEQGVFEFPKGSILSFTLKLNGREYTFLSGLEGIEKYDATNFFLVHYQSKKIKLITKHFSVLQNLGSNNYGSTTQEYTYSKEKDLYIYKDSKGILVKRNKKSILEVLGGDKKIWEEYIKNNKLDMKKEEDIARLIQFYDSKNP
ncbi:hypothetical protein AD998_16970 [bacterium 336/3]|nr:hypothetical protein AD998_16970 [bacterium 336/3]